MVAFLWLVLPIRFIQKNTLCRRKSFKLIYNLRYFNVECNVNKCYTENLCSEEYTKQIDLYYYLSFCLRSAFSRTLWEVFSNSVFFLKHKFIVVLVCLYNIGLLPFEDPITIKQTIIQPSDRQRNRSVMRSAAVRPTIFISLYIDNI